MNQRLLLLSIVFLIFISLLAGPALAATVTCPSTCSCLLPAEAAKINTPGLCGGKQTVCGSDGKINKYCYARPASVTTTTALPQLIATGFHPVPTTTTAPVFVKCSPGCSCEYEPEGMIRNLTLCGGRQYLCGMDYNGVKKYCYVTPQRPSNETTLITKTPGVILATSTPPTMPLSTVPPSRSPAAAVRAVPAGISSSPTSVPPSLPGVSGRTSLIPKAVACPQGCTCLDNATIAEGGYEFCGGSPVICGYSSGKGVYFCANTSGGSITIAQKPEPGNVLSAITGIIASIFGQTTPRPEPSSDTSRMYIDYCRMRYGLTSCDSGCANLSEDMGNCGRCDTSCRPPSSFVPESCCAGTCVDFMTDPRNCGECGYVCPEGAPCVEGICSATGCRDPILTMCNNTCSDTRRDSQNCGSCGNTCPPGLYCEAGSCTACWEGGRSCPSFGGGWVDYTCVDTSLDRHNCGECRHTCADYQTCTGGVCTDCLRDETLCDYNVCKNLHTDVENCGFCGHECGRGETCCGGICSALDDSFNCAACGIRCGPGQICFGGTCTDCPAGTEGCRSTHGWFICVDPGERWRYCMYP